MSAYAGCARLIGGTLAFGAAALLALLYQGQGGFGFVAIPLANAGAMLLLYEWQKRRGADHPVATPSERPTAMIIPFRRVSH